MSFKDMIKNSVLESFSSDITPQRIIIVLLAALVLGLYVFVIYRMAVNNEFYSKDFNRTLVLMAVVTAGIVLAIQSNLVISLGMVGALSIVRFRTAVKDPLDLLYLFWSITTGITAGAGMYALTLVAAVIMIIMIAIFYSRSSNGKIYIAVIHYEGTEAGDEILRAFGKKKYFVKSKTIRGDVTELAVEVNVKGDDFFFEEKIRNIDNVKDVTLIQYNGEYNA